MRPIDADALINEIKKDAKKAIEQDDRVGSFWLGYIAGLVIKQPTIQPEERSKKRMESHARDLISRQAAIDIIEAGRLTKLIDAETVINGLKELPSAQTKQSACEYCHEDSDGYVTPIEKNGHAFIRFGMGGWELSLHAKGWHGSAKIKYCPICGRSLTHG